MDAKIPLLAPPPPRFPTRFQDREETQQEPAPHPAAPWPSDETCALGERSTGGVGSGGEVVWQLKTEREEHLDTLESKLHRLKTQSPPALDDSGYGSHPPSTVASAAFSDEDDEVTTTAGEALAVGIEEEEGQALLSAPASPGSVDRPVRGRTRTRESSASTDEDADVSGEEAGLSRRDELPFRMPPNHARNVSFNTSVRISSGRGGHSHRHQHSDAFFASPPPQNAVSERTSLLSAQPRPISAPSPLLVASITASSSQPCRSVSPGPSRTRRQPSSAYSSSPSRSTSPGAYNSRQSSRRPSLTNHLSSSYLHSTSPGATASYPTSMRSSSPCSSIYAPLQPPSRFTPNPMYVRPSGTLGRIGRKRSSSQVSFQDYLRGTKRGYDEHPDEVDSETDDDEAASEVERLEYHELVEEQRRKRARWEARRRAKDAARKRRREDGQVRTSFWERLAQLLALGIAGSSNGRGAAAPVNVLIAPPTPTKQQLRQGRGGSKGAERERGSSPARPSPLAAATFASSSDDELLLPQHVRPSRSRRPPPSISTSPSSTPPKTELDARFGSAPSRYFTWSWIRFRLREVREAAIRAWETALRGWRRHLIPVSVGAEEDGYEEV